MKASLLQEHLITPLTFVGKNAAYKTQIPITQYVLVLAEKGQLRFVTTTGDTTIASTIPAKVEKEGGVCVLSKMLLEFVVSLQQGKVVLEVKDDALSVVCGGCKGVFPGMNQKEFPPLPRKNPDDRKTDAKDFVSAVKSVISAAATDEGRPLLTGVKIMKTKDGALFVATDGYRLSLKKTTTLLDEGFDMVIPARALSHVLPIGEKDGLEFVRMSGGQIGFFIEENEVYTRTIEGEYPAFDRIIPKSYTTQMTVVRESFVKAVKTAAIFAKDNANIVRFHIEEGRVTISANTPQIGEGSVEVESAVEGDGGDIAFNSRFLLDFLNNVNAEKLVFEMTGSLNPGLFKIEGDDSFLHIIMPVRVQG